MRIEDLEKIQDLIGQISVIAEQDTLCGKGRSYISCELDSLKTTVDEELRKVVFEEWKKNRGK